MTPGPATSFTTPITGLYAAVFATFVIALALRVVMLRRSRRIGIGTGGDEELARAARVHANNAEILPLALILILILELGGAAPAVLHGAGGTLMVGRILHAVGLGRRSGRSFGRFWGTAITWSATLAMAVLAAFGWLEAG